MLTERMFKKMFVTSSIVVILLLVYLMPGVIELNNNEIATSVEYVDLSSSIIYLVDDNGLLVESTVSVIDDGNVINKIKSLIKHLSDASEEIVPNGLNCVIPNNIEVIEVKVEEKIVLLEMSKELLELEKKKVIRLVEAISHTLLKLDEVDGVSILVDGINISELVDYNIPSIINSDFGINKRYDINRTDNVIKYVVYYSENIENNTYYVPVTKYVNSNQDKINIIIEDLSSSYIYQPNLVSIASEKLELINYDISNDEMILNFNNSIFLNNEGIVEEVVYPVMSTFFSNYDVESVILKVNGEEILKKSEKIVE